MHPPELKQAALALIADGHNDCEVARRLGVARGTIRDWRRPSYAPQARSLCPRCWRKAKRMCLAPSDYSELLAMYLGDGSISTHPRTQRLRVTLDAKYPAIIREAQSLIARCFPENRVDQVQAPGCVHVSVYSSHLSCVFPQHGPGRKHNRSIVLEGWQEQTIRAEPWPFVRGCILTDGCVFTNRTDVHRESPYEYLSYHFSNRSKEIVDLFVASCDRVGVFTRVNHQPTRGEWSVRINRRPSVALMLEHVGLKS